MNQKYTKGQIIKNKTPTKINICKHKNLVPLEIGLARKSYPNGFSAEPYYNFAINSIGANIVRVKSYLCLDCKKEIKAPNPDTIKKDIL